MIRRHTVILLAGLLHAAPALAQADMFTGRWRAMSAEPAPFGQGSPPAAPLLRRGLIIGAGQVQGPEPIACAGAAIQPADIPREVIFGQNPGSWDVKRFLKDHNFPDRDATALRVTCPGRETLLYLTGNSEIVSIIDGVLYTFRRASAEEPTTDDRAFVAKAEASFDCAKASSTAERIICRWPDTLGADQSMGVAYQRLRRSLGAQNAEALVLSQRVYLEYLMKSCRVSGAAPKKREAEAAVSTCIAETMNTRRDFLAALSVSTAGGLRIEPRLTTQFRMLPNAEEDASAASGWVTQDAVPVLLGASPAVARAFSAQVRRLLRDDRPLIGGRNDLRGTVSRSYTVGTLDEGFLSLRAEEHVEAGTRVPDVGTSLNFDLKAGRPVTLDGIFNRSPAWRDAVSEALKRDLNAPSEFDEHRKAILDGARGFIWLFKPEGVTVSWELLGGAPETVDIPASALRPFLKASSPWQPAR